MHPVHYSQALIGNTGTVMTTAGQIIATSTGNFPQHGAAANQQSLSNCRPKIVVECRQEGKYNTFQNQLPVLQPTSLYGSNVPVQSSSQILNGCHIREISSQPQIITSQASGTMLNQAQLLGLPPGSPWAPSGIHLGQNRFLIYTQPSGMTVHQIRPPMAMHLPVSTAALPIPITPAVIAPRMQKYPKIKPKVKIVKGPSCIGQQNQLPSTPAAQLKYVASSHTDPNLVYTVNDQTISTGIENESVSDKTEIPSPQRSQSMILPFSEILQVSVSPIPTVDASVASMTPSTLTIGSCACETPSPSNTEMVTTNAEINHAPSTSVALSDKDKQPLMAAVKPQVLTHIINGFIIQESSEPFPVSQSSCRVLLHKKLNLPEEKENSPTENKVRALRPRRNVEFAKCEFCRKLGPKFRFKRSKRVCSKFCAKQFNKHTYKRVKHPVSAIQEHVGSGGRGHKGKSFSERKCLQKQLLVEDESNATPAKEILPTSENESGISYKTNQENSEPFGNSNHTQMEVDKSSDEVELLKSNLSEKLPSKWTVQDVFEFIQNLPGYSDYADNFISQEVDGQALLLLKENHLMTAMYMKLGPAIKLLSQIRSMEEKLQL